MAISNRNEQNKVHSLFMYLLLQIFIFEEAAVIEISQVIRDCIKIIKYKFKIQFSRNIPTSWSRITEEKLVELI